jgi:hypothetical protein
MKRTLVPVVVLMLTGCQGDPAAPTAEENRQLDEAANMLNQAPANLEAIDDGGLGEANAPEEAAPENSATGAGSY